jgi:hypothetical protein
MIKNPSPEDAAKRAVLKNYAGKMARLEIENKHGRFAVHQDDAEKWLVIVDEEGIPGCDTEFSDSELGSLDVRFKMALDAIQKFLRP